MIDTLAALPVGDGWVYAPDVDMLERQHFPPIETIDNSATPKAGEVRGEIGELAKPDLGQLLAAMTPAEAEAKPSTKGDAKAYERGVAAGRAALEEAEQHAFSRGFGAGRKDALAALREWMDSLPSDEPERSPVGSPAGSPIGNHPVARARKSKAEMAATAEEVEPVKKAILAELGAVEGVEVLPEAAQGLLDAARGAWRQVSWTEACVLAGLRPGGGYYNTLRKKLSDAGFKEPPAPAGGRNCLASSSLIDGWASKLVAPLPTILRMLYERGPLSRAEIADALQLKMVGGYWNTVWKRIKANVAFTERDGGWDIHPILRELKEREHRAAA